MTTGGNPPRTDPIGDTESEDVIKEEKSTGALEKKTCSLEGRSWADHTRVAQNTVCKGIGRTTSPPKNKLCLLDPLWRNTRTDKTQGGVSNAEREEGIE